jgi:hypothetical protein
MASGVHWLIVGIPAARLEGNLRSVSAGLGYNRCLCRRERGRRIRLANLSTARTTRR